MNRQGPIRLLILCGGLTAGAWAASQQPAPKRAAYATDRILVRYRANASVGAMAAMAQRRALHAQNTLPGSGITVIQVPAGETPESLIERLKTEESSTVADARPDFLRQALFAPNDPFLSAEYQINKCSLPAA